MNSKMVIKYMGSKWYLSNWIISHFPKHDVFVDVFGGSGAVILAKPRSKIEVYNDINDDLVNLFEILRKRKEEFKRQLKYLLYSRALRKKWTNEWKKGNKPQDPLERALWYYFLLNTSISGKIFSGFSTSNIRNNTLHLRKFEQIDNFADRFANVIIEKLDYRELVKKYDSENTLFYCDPPYMVPRADEYYPSERWNFKEHKEFADVVNNLKGKVIISYYWAPYLEFWYLKKGWHMDKCIAVKHSKITKTTREKSEELLLMNFDWKKEPKFIDLNQQTLKNISSNLDFY